MPVFRLKYLRHRCSEILGNRELLQACARYLLLGLLIYAPWAYGSTRPDLVTLLDEALFCCLGLHVLGLIVERRLPRYPLVPSVCLGLLIAQGGWMYFNAQSSLDDDYWEFVPLDQPFPGLPGSWDKAASLSKLMTIGAMSGAFLVASDMLSRPSWKPRLWRTIALAGGSIVVYGLVQKAFGAEWAFSMFHGQKIDPTFFGPFRYHANAGDYLNIVWPVLLILYIQSTRKRHAYAEQTLWSCLLVLALAACFVNTSKAAAFITGGMLVAAFFAFVPFFRNDLIRSRRVSRVLMVLFATAFLGILVYGGITSQLQSRWNVMFGTNVTVVEAESRVLVDQICMRMVPEAGWFGFGPGTFSSVFPFHTGYLGKQIQGFWIYAHEDYLQTVIEYGYLGAALWSIVFFGSMAMAAFRGLQPHLRTHDLLAYRASVLILTGLALHSLVDFPLQIASIELYVTVLFAYAWSRPDEAKRLRPPST